MPLRTRMAIHFLVRKLTGYYFHGQSFARATRTLSSLNFSFSSPHCNHSRSHPIPLSIMMMEDSVTLNGSETGEDPIRLKEIGNQAFKDGHFDKAIEHYTKAIGKTPSQSGQLQKLQELIREHYQFVLPIEHNVILDLKNSVFLFNAMLMM
jgi:hypothetical protein